MIACFALLLPGRDQEATGGITAITVWIVRASRAGPALAHVVSGLGGSQRNPSGCPSTQAALNIGSAVCPFLVPSAHLKFMLRPLRPRQQERLNEQSTTRKNR